MDTHPTDDELDNIAEIDDIAELDDIDELDDLWNEDDLDLDNNAETCQYCGTPLRCEGAASHGDGDIFDEYYCYLCQEIRLEIHASYCLCEDCQEGISKFHRVYD
jgi:hypothetical protein